MSIRSVPPSFRAPLRLVSGIAVLAAALALACGQRGGEGASAEEQTSGDRAVAHVRIEGQLDVGHLGQLKRALDLARDAGSDRLIVELETPGGEVDLMWKVSNALRHSASEGVLPIAWVHQRAVSAGAFAALSCERIYMSPAATIGAAMPVQAGPAGIQALPEEGGVRQKLVAELRAEFRAMAEAHNRSPVLAEAMIDPDLGVVEIQDEGERRLVSGDEWAELRLSARPPELVRTIARPGELVSLSAQEAVELGFADGIAGSLAEVLDKLGKSGAEIVGVERARSDDVLSWLERLAPLLLVAGLLLAWTEIKMPGFGLPGILAIACFAVLLAGRWLAGLADIPHVVAIALGAALIAVEVFVMPGTLWTGILGGVLVLGGLVSSSLGPGFGFGNALGRSLLVDAAFDLLLTATLAVVGALVLSRLLPKTPLLRGLVLVPGESGAGGGAMPESEDAHARAAAPGRLGRAVTSLRPVGKVVLDGAQELEYEARAVGPLIERGERVRVLEVGAGRLVVEALPAPPAPESPA